MEPLISFCGMECSACPAHIATRENNDDLKRKTAEEWSKLFKMDINPEQVTCNGCTAAGPFSAYCTQCEIRKCGLAKNLQSCASCDDYVCEKLAAIHRMEPECRKRLDALRSGKAEKQ